MSIICKILSVIVSIGGLVVSIIEYNSPVMFFCFLLGGLIAFELADIIENTKK